MEGFSPAFLAEVVRELDRVVRQVDRLDMRIERAKREETKDRLSSLRAGWIAYERQLRKMLR